MTNNPPVWLAFEALDGSGNESHVKWEGHETLDTARLELEALLENLKKTQGKFPNTYVYQAEKPLYGYTEEKLDSVIAKLK
jgi:hypothetical protein